jgi:type I restriction enzyme S subunit
MSDVAEVIMGQSPPGATYNSDGNGLPFYQGKAEFGSVFPTPRKWCSAPTKIAKAGDILLSVRAPVGPTNLCRETSAIGRGLAALRPKAGLPSKYLLYALQASEGDLRRCATGTTFEAVSGKVVRSHAVTVAPAGIQNDVVAAIEQQLTRIDAAAAALLGAKAKVRRFRNAALNEVVPARGAAVPNGWRWASVGELAPLVQYGTSAKTTPDPHGVPVLRMGNIVDGHLDIHDLKYLRAAHAEFPELLLEDGDVLFNRTNSPELVGKAAVYKGVPSPCSFASYLIRVHVGPDLLPEFLVHSLNGSFGRRWIADVVSQQVGQANVNGSKLKAFRIPVPPIAEQERLVGIAASRLALVEESEVEIRKNLLRARSLRQAVLRRAFAGRLT